MFCLVGRKLKNQNGSITGKTMYFETIKTAVCMSAQKMAGRELDGVGAVVTGGASGIGRAVRMARFLEKLTPFVH